MSLASGIKNRRDEISPFLEGEDLVDCEKVQGVRPAGVAKGRGEQPVGRTAMADLPVPERPPELAGGLQKQAGSELGSLRKLNAILESLEVDPDGQAGGA